MFKQGCETNLFVGAGALLCEASQACRHKFNAVRAGAHPLQVTKTQDFDVLARCRRHR
jgi:hypothetical protein